MEEVITSERARAETALAVQKSQLAFNIDGVLRRVSDLQIKIASGQGGAAEQAWKTGLARSSEYAKRLLREQELLRAPIQADTLESERANFDLPGQIRQATPPGLELRYHGAGIVSSEGIINSRNLSSSPDRVGFESSWDVAGQVSITTANHVEVSIEYPTIKHNRNFCLPAGCLFVVRPLPEESDPHLPVISNVDFLQSPERLAQVVTSDEMKPYYQDLMKQAGLDSGLVCTFAEYPGRIASLAG